MNKKIIIGTRGSELALWQAKYTQQLLSRHNISSELKIIVTSGDKNQQWENSFDKLEGKNFFTKEIEEALLNKEIDLAVHSFKDVEAVFYEDDHPLVIAGLSKRHTPNDVLILLNDCVDKQYPLHISCGAKIGTSSSRRYAQLHTFRPDVKILPLRGNVPTRINKLKNRQYDGIILAQAGIERLNISLDEFYVMPLPLYYFVPAAGQGIIAFQARREDEEILQLIKKISDTDAEICGKSERKVLQFTGGGCSKPIGVLCEKHLNKFRMYVSFNTDKEQPSVLSIIEDVNADTLINTTQKIIQNIQYHLQNPVSKKVFISKQLSEDSYLKKIIQRLKWNIADVTLIKTEALPANDLPSFDWIFFSSKNAVKYFLESYGKDVLKDKKTGCLSVSTSGYLEAQGISADYTGTENDIQSIAEDFLKKCKHQTVLFPCSNISNQSIGQYISGMAEAVYFPVYKTTEIHQELNEQFDYLIFTSPSNVRAFLKKNQIKDNAKIIAMGESTEKELLKHGIKNEIFLPAIFNENGIVAALMCCL